MIEQKVKLVKLVTDDGHIDVGGAPVKPGLEFWIRCNTYRISQARDRKTGEQFTVLMVETEQGTMIPVELLKFSSEFRVTSA